MLARILRLGMVVTGLTFTLAHRVEAGSAQWDFNDDLESSTGQPALVPLAASPAVDPDVTFDTVQIGGQDAVAAHFSQGTYFDVPHGFPPNGGGAYVNQFTIIMDVMFPDRSPSESVTSLLQTNCCNQNDGDWFINPDGGLGVDGNFGGSVPDGEWHRLALVVDLAAGTYTSYVDGVQVQQNTGQDLDGRFSLYSPNDGDPDPYETFFIFADDSGENSEGYINSLQVHDIALSAGVIAEIGGPSAAGIPKNVCIFPPAVATRDIVTTRTPEETNGDYLPGDVIDVSITISDIRAAAGTCIVPAGIVVVETLPAGWTPSQITDGGSYDAGQRRITWVLTGGAFVEGKKLTYKVTSAATAELGVSFVGSVTENVAGAKPSPVNGDTTLLSDIPFDSCGGIRCWNILGAYRQPFGASPGDSNLRLDYLTDGDVVETQFVFLPGAQVATAFGGDGVSGAASTGISGGTKGRNPTGVPTVFAWNDREGVIDLNDEVFGGNPDNVMAYAQTYVINTTGTPMDVYLGISSDDSVQVLLNGEEVWYRSAGRAGSDACSPQDVSPDGGIFTDPHVLDPGENSLIVKVWEGGGDWNFAIRFQDDTGQKITDGLQISKYPSGICPVPPLRAARSIDTQKTVTVQGVEYPRWEDGETYDVAIAISDIRAASGSCAAPTSVKIEETVPPGWTPSAASNGGTIAAGKITWTLTGATLAPATLRYQVKAAGVSGDVTFLGKISEVGSPVLFAVGGDSLLSNPSDLTDQGFVKSWLLLGPYQQPVLGGGPAPGLAAIRLDYMTDGAGINEKNVAPRDGDVVHTDYRRAARSIGLASPPTPVPINPGGVPTWKAWRDIDDTIAFNDYYGGDLNQIMMYALTYVSVDADRTVDLGLASDDSIQVLLDGVEVHINNVARGFDASNTVTDIVPGVSLTAGIHRLLVKVFEGTGDHGFRLRFHDENGDPITEGIEICLDPACADKAPPVTVFHRGDADVNGATELTDAVRILNYLFLGSGVIDCLDAADADDNGALELTDAVRILNYLFLGSGTIPAPGPTSEPCGPDPTADDILDCASYPACG